MATRFYFSKIPGYSFVFARDSSWEVDSGITLIMRLLGAKGDPAAEALISQAAFTSLNVPAGAVDRAHGQWVSKRLSSAATISGSIKGYILASEGSALADYRMQCVIRVIGADGTVRGTLVASDASALTSEFATTLTNRAIPLGSPVTPTSVAALAGDRIVVEMGARKHENAVTSRTATFRLGAPSDGSDIAENETDTTDGVGWIEFTDNLSFTEADPPLFVGAGTGVADASGTFTANKSSVTVDNVIVVQLLQDGTGASPALDSVSGIAALDGTASSLTSIGEFDVGSAVVASQHLWIGRATGTTATVTSTAGATDDSYLRVYEFSGVSTGTTLATVIENVTAGATVNGAATSGTIADAGVTTLGADRLALNFVGISDDNAVAAFTGMTGGTWAEAVAEFASATGSDACIQLQTATMATAGTIDGGTATNPDATDGWGAVGFALIGTPTGYQPRHGFVHLNDPGIL